MLGLILSVDGFCSELYRYQDESGRWVFGDKKSLKRNIETQAPIEKVVFKDERIKIPKPNFDYVKKVTNEGPMTFWQLFNPLPVTVQHTMAIKGERVALDSIISKPFETLTLSPEMYQLPDDVKIDHYYLIGGIIDRPESIQISPPYSKKKRFLISQGFNGQFSHTNRGNRYAVDIAMPIGEKILAVSNGIVADARDDFSIGGAADYFLDKANHVTIMHDDGSYAIYAHILHGSLSVVLGQRVEAGQVLARIGNTGYSTGPHLHFVMRYNSGKGGYSIPFKFITSEGAKVPTKGRYYLGQVDQIKNSAD
jgi:murein DD-endopeptidase MepM/ murein hydrolase activator NlpD